MIIWLNGAFGSGKTTCAFELNRRPLKEMLDAGFECFYHKSKSGGDIYRYRKKFKK